MAWIEEVNGTIITIVTHRANKNLIKDFPDLFFTSDEENNIQSAFPTVFLNFVPIGEVGQDLTNDAINGFDFAYEIDCTASQEQGLVNANHVVWEVIEQFKRLGFNVVTAPKAIPTGNNTKRVVARVRRIIGANDKIG